MEWFNYLIQVNIYLILFYAFYKLVLQNETFFKWNRVFLVLSGALSFLIPTLQSHWVKSLFVSKEIVYMTEAITLDEIRISSAEEVGFAWSQFILAIYLLGIVVFLIKFLWQLSQISKSFKQPNQALSFFKKVSVSENLSSRESIIKHEEVHASQLHSADVMIFEIISIINWFNPVVYAYKKSVKFIHEFIADEVASADADKSEYALLLVSNVFGIQKEQLANNFYNQSLLKKRIMMLHKTKSRKAAILKYGLSAPLFAMMVILSSATINEHDMESLPVSTSSKIVDGITSAINAADAGLNTTKQSSETISETLARRNEHSFVPKNDTSAAISAAEVDVMPVYPGGITEFYNWIGKNYKYPEETKAKQIYGRMVIQFIVEKSGELTDVRTLKDLGYGTAEEAVRLLKSSKVWKPGIKNGKPVRVQFVLPIQLNKPIEVGTTDSSTLNVVGFKKGEGLASEKVVYFLDGKTITKADMQKLDPNSIESINVIKDKSQFGNHNVPEGTEGIILITLKK
jgi:TonB family protein